MIASRWLRLGAVASALSLGCGDVASDAPDGAPLDGSFEDSPPPTDVFSRLDASDAPPVACTSSSCGVGLTCCGLTGRCYDPNCRTCCESPDGGPLSDVATPRDSTCATNDDCSAYDYCAGESCGASGRCVTRPMGCTIVSASVCGCDGVTYVNACTAAARGARVALRGECLVPRDAGVPLDARVDAGSVVCSGLLCSVGLSCCDRPGSPAYGACFDPSCRTCCTPSAASDAGPPPPDARPGDCLTNTDCTAPQTFCGGPGCGVRGNCELRPMGCPTVFDPVCGCDGRTYSNPCEASSAGVRVASRGACLAPALDASVGRDVPLSDASISVCATIRCSVGYVCCDAPHSPLLGSCYDARCASCCR